MICCKVLDYLKFSRFVREGISSFFCYFRFFMKCLLQICLCKKKFLDLRSKNVACKNKHLQSFHSKYENYGMQFTINKIWQELNFEFITQKCTLRNIGHKLLFMVGSLQYQFYLSLIRAMGHVLMIFKLIKISENTNKLLNNYISYVKILIFKI